MVISEKALVIFIFLGICLGGCKPPAEETTNSSVKSVYSAFSCTKLRPKLGKVIEVFRNPELERPNNEYLYWGWPDNGSTNHAVVLGTQKDPNKENGREEIAKVVFSGKTTLNNDEWYYYFRIDESKVQCLEDSDFASVDSTEIDNVFSEESFGPYQEAAFYCESKASALTKEKLLIVGKKIKEKEVDANPAPVLMRFSRDYSGDGYRDFVSKEQMEQSGRTVGFVGAKKFKTDDIEDIVFKLEPPLAGVTRAGKVKYPKKEDELDGRGDFHELTCEYGVPKKSVVQMK